MSKPTHASVTEQSCECNYLQDASNNPDIPIVFDEQTGSFYFTYGEPDCEGHSTLVIYHCPFCGGAAPESNPVLLFAVIPRDEEDRLIELLSPIKTIDDALKTLGEPEFDDHTRIHRPEREQKPPSATFLRRILYEKLSEVADAWMTERPDGTASWQLLGKYVGTPGE